MATIILLFYASKETNFLRCGVRGPLIYVILHLYAHHHGLLHNLSKLQVEYYHMHKICRCGDLSFCKGQVAQSPNAIFWTRDVRN